MGKVKLAPRPAALTWKARNLVRTLIGGCSLRVGRDCRVLGVMENDNLAALRRDIERYERLLKSVSDARASDVLRQLIEERRRKLAEAEWTQSSDDGG